MSSTSLFRLCYRIRTLSSNGSAIRPAIYAARAFSTTPAVAAKPLPPRRVIPETDIIENFLKGSGPGGQKINKTSSAVQLKHIPTGIVVKCQDTRSRTQNRKTARKLLGERLEELELGDQSRTAVKAKERSKKKASADKKKKRKYKALQEAKEADEEGEEVDGEELGERHVDSTAEAGARLEGPEQALDKGSREKLG